MEDVPEVAVKDSLVTKLRDLVVTRWGRAQWEAIVADAGLNGLPATLYTELMDLDPSDVRRIVESTMSALNTRWVDHYGAPVGPRAPVRMSYEWKSSDRVVVRYQSHATLVDLLIGLLETVGDRLHEEVTVVRTGPNRVDVALAP